MDRRTLLSCGTGVALLGGAALLMRRSPAKAAPAQTFAVQHSDAEWRRLLTPAQYDILRRAGTEAPGSSPLLDEHHRGVFACAGCDQAAFSSSTKFDSGTGWPSFYAPLPRAVSTAKDDSLGMTRDEVHCERCGGHLGHVFDDGPLPTGLRYCMNGAALKFQAA
jgi:peptide-methionine (R)-S-oxide reductase